MHKLGRPLGDRSTLRLFIGLGNYGVGVAGRREEIAGASWWYLGRPWKFGMTGLNGAIFLMRLDLGF
jgi:hypothetical protein